jgi:FlaA1/EpsC-like NDP-sugar epimerase
MAIHEAVWLVFKQPVWPRWGVMVLDWDNQSITMTLLRCCEVLWRLQCQVIVTGLRPGEKLYEELLANKDTTIPTEEKLVFKAKVNNHTISELSFLTHYLTAFEKGSPEQMLAMLHELVPEFKDPKL